MEVVCVVVAVVSVVDMEKNSGSTMSVLCEGLIVKTHWTAVWEVAERLKIS